MDIQPRRFKCMKAFILTGLVLWLMFLDHSAFSQFAVSAEYQWLESPWQDHLSSVEPGDEYASNIASVSAFYWFRLKDKRIEFLPEIGYSFAVGDHADLAFVDQQRISAAFNMDIYLLDLLNDCDCPTFSKQSGFFKRSLFLEISPGVDYQMISLNDKTEVGRNYDDNAFTFRMGLGLGFDFGVSDLVTITPIVGIDYGTRPNWPGLQDAIGYYPGNDPSNTTPDGRSEWTFHAGIRVLFRPDYRRRYR